MRRRKIHRFFESLAFYLSRLPLLPLGFVLEGILWFGLRTSVVGSYQTIRITASEEKEINERFAFAMKNALRLIEQHDSQRWRVVRKEIHYIDNTPTTEYGAYQRLFRQCEINFYRFGFTGEAGAIPPLTPQTHLTVNNRKPHELLVAAESAVHEEWRVAVYATVIVHEATHGRLRSLGFPYNKQTRVRIERICEAEARRFAARLPQTRYAFAENLIPPFDASRWQASWNRSRWEEAREVWRRMKQQGNE